MAVKVDNSRQPGSRWYSGSGIYRHTWLVAVNPVHIGHWGTFVTTPRVARDAATVQVRPPCGTKGRRRPALHVTAIVDHEGKVVQTAEVSQEIGANADYEFAQQMAVDKPNLWSVAQPYLYTLRSTVRVGQQVVDEYDTPTGIREALFDADKGFLLNGEHGQAQRRLPAPRRRRRGRRRAGARLGAPPGILRDGLQRHPHQPQPAGAGVPGSVRPHGLPGDERGLRRMARRQAPGARQRLFPLLR